MSSFKLYDVSPSLQIYKGYTNFKFYKSTTKAYSPQFPDHIINIRTMLDVKELHGSTHFNF